MGNAKPRSARRAKTPQEAAAHVRRILKEIEPSLFEKYKPVGVGEEWRYDAKRSFGKALH